MAVMVMMMMMAGASDTAMANSKNVMAQHAVNLRFYSLNLGTEVRKRRGCRVIKIYIWPFQNWMSCMSFCFELDLNQSMDSKTCLSSGWPDCHLSSSSPSWSGWSDCLLSCHDHPADGATSHPDRPAWKLPFRLSGSRAGSCCVSGNINQQYRYYFPTYLILSGINLLCFSSLDYIDLLTSSNMQINKHWVLLIFLRKASPRGVGRPWYHQTGSAAPSKPIFTQFSVLLRKKLVI